MYKYMFKIPEKKQCMRFSFIISSFESKLPEIFRDVHEAHQKIDARLKAEQFKVFTEAFFH